MENCLTDCQYQALLKVHQRLYHCHGWEDYLKLHAVEYEQDFTRLFDLLCMLDGRSEVSVMENLQRRFKQLSLIASIEYVKKKLELAGAPVDLQAFLTNRMVEEEHNSLMRIEWQKPERARLVAITAHQYEWSSVISSQLALESKVDKKYFIAANCVSTKDFFAITYAAEEWPYTYEPWLSWFLYLQTTELNEIQTWPAYKTYTIDLLLKYRSNATMLFDLYLQALALIWPKEVPIPDLTALVAAAAAA
jgi:hypothetical protein